MRVLLINPNTSPAITDLIVGTARSCASPRTEFVGATGRFGARYIVTRTAAAIAGHAALDAYAEHGRDADVIGLACFGDPGLAALKEVAVQPVVGMAEASCLEAAAGGRRFAIVTGGEGWRAMLEEFVVTLGLANSLAVVKTVAPSGGEIARDPARAYDLLAYAATECVRESGAECVILGGAGLAGIAGEISDRVPCPIIDSVAALVRAVERLGHQQPARSSNSRAKTATVPTTGLSAAPTRLLEGNEPNT